MNLNRAEHVLALMHTLQREAPYQPCMGEPAWEVVSKLDPACWYLSWRQDVLKLGDEERGWCWEGECPPTSRRSLAVVKRLLKRARNLDEAVLWASQEQ
jgi:hypothetical protein